MHLHIYTSFVVILNIANASKYWLPLYNTNTPYRYVKSLSEDVAENQESTVFFNGRIYCIVNIYFFLRHGSRSPLLFEIKGINYLYNRIKTNPRVLDKNPFLRNWTNPFPEDLAYKQYEAGNEEQSVLAKRHGMMFKELYEGNLHRIKYSITKTNVSAQSHLSFYDSLIRLFNLNRPRPSPVIDMNKLHFFDQCKKFDRLRQSGRKKYNTFLGGPEMQKVLRNVGRRLGTRNITIGQTTCVAHYWERTYGLAINRQTSCLYTSDLFKTFDQFVENKEYPDRLNISNINFAHGFTLFPLYTAFEIIPDVPPLFVSEYKLNRNRLFRASIFNPMSANFAVALYKCNDDYVVKMFVNEESIIIPRLGCRVCPYNYFRWTFNSLTYCKFDKICENN